MPGVCRRQGPGATHRWRGDDSARELHRSQEGNGGSATAIHGRHSAAGVDPERLESDQQPRCLRLFRIPKGLRPKSCVKERTVFFGEYRACWTAGCVSEIQTPMATQTTICSDSADTQTAPAMAG